MKYIIDKEIYYPKPRKFDELICGDNVEKHRRLNCLFYGSCLDHALSFHWDGFSCLGCSHYIKDKYNEDDADKCMNLLLTIFQLTDKEKNKLLELDFKNGKRIKKIDLKKSCVKLSLSQMSKPHKILLKNTK